MPNDRPHAAVRTPATEQPARFQFGAGDSQSVPRNALRFDVSDVQIGDNGTDSKTAPLKMVARTGQPIEHWYWGQVVHDMAGMQLSKPRIPVDYCHDCDQVIGYANKFDTETGDLVVSGALIPYSANPDDRATEVLYKAKAGVPYEASINFCGDGIVAEEVPAGYSAQVNGYTFEGPGIIIRKWPLRGIAVCPYGADMDTSTEFSNQQETVTVRLNHQENSKMSTSATTNVPAKAAALTAPAVEAGVKSTAPATEAKPANPPTSAVELAQGAKAEAAPTAPAVEATQKPGAEFVAAFGDVGARWFLEGKQFSACATEFVAEMRKKHSEEITAFKTEIDALKTKLAALPRGNEPAAFSVADGKAADVALKAKQLSSGLSEGMAKFAAGIVLPADKAK